MAAAHVNPDSTIAIFADNEIIEEFINNIIEDKNTTVIIILKDG